MEEKKELLNQDERVVEIELERLRGFVNHTMFVCIVVALMGGCWKTYDSEMQRNVIMIICFAVTGILGAVSWCGMAKIK